MALLFLESFAACDTTALFGVKWSNAVSLNAQITGRFAGSKAVQCTSNSCRLEKALPTAIGTIVSGFAYRPVTAALASTSLWSCKDAGSSQISLTRNTSGNISVRRGGGAGTVLGSSTYALSLNAWVYIEVKVVIHNSTGSVVVKVNGVEVLNLTGQDTQATANATVDAVWLGYNSEGQNQDQHDYSDFYVLDTTGSAPTNDFLGDIRVEAILPSGNGNSSVLVGSDGNSTDNYLLVDDPTPDSDTTYVESSTVGDKDTYAYGNVTPTTGTVFGVQLSPFAKKTDAGARSIVSVARLSATEVDSAAKALATGYAFLADIREAKPGGGVWSITDVNNAEFGVKVDA